MATRYSCSLISRGNPMIMINEILSRIAAPSSAPQSTMNPGASPRFEVGTDSRADYTCARARRNGFGDREKRRGAPPSISRHRMIS